MASVEVSPAQSGTARADNFRMSRVLALVVAAVSAVGCASTGAVPQPFPRAARPPLTTPGPGVPTSTTPPVEAETPATSPAAIAPSASAFDGYAISSTALALRGAPYRDGGDSPAGFDCSGFVYYVFAQHGVTVPRDVRNQYRVGEDVEGTTLQPGDLVFFSTVARGASHVGILIGGDEFVHAPSSNGVVRVERLSARYWADRYIGARRPQP